MTPVAYVARVLKGRSAGGRRLAIVMCEMICVGTVAGWGRGWSRNRGIVNRTGTVSPFRAAIIMTLNNCIH